MKKGNRRVPKFRRRAEARPDDILDAAMTLFIERGFSGTRVEDIAKRAGLSKGSVYLYFSSKEALLEGLVKRAIVPVADTALASLAEFDGDPRELLTLFLTGVASQLGDAKVFAIPKIIMREAVIAPQIAAIYRNAVLDRALPALMRVVAKGIEDGHFRKVDPELAVRSIMGPVATHIMLAEVFGVRPQHDVSMQEFLQTHLSILFDGLCLPEVAA